MERVSPGQVLYQQRQCLSIFIEKRSALLERIGTGEVKVGSSWEATLKVGRTRRDVSMSVVKKQIALQDVNNQIAGYERAQGYQDEIVLRQRQLGQMAELQAQGYLREEVLRDYQARYEDLVAEPETNFYLRRGLELLQQEHATIVSTTTPIQRDQQSDTERLDSSNEIPQFNLPNGKIVIGKTAEILQSLQMTAKDSMVKLDELAQRMYPGVERTVARKRVKAQVSYAKHVLSREGEHALDVIGVTGLTTADFAYYLKRNGEE